MTINSKLDLSYLETMSMGNTNTMITLLEALLSELKSDQHTARKLCEQKDWVGLERFCHHYKSTLSFSGDKALINANLKLWDCAIKYLENKEVNPKDVQQQLTIMERNGQKVAQEVSRILKNL
jgi:HPt (histidine-containing phosphotransfer) domain-containing protein